MKPIRKYPSMSVSSWNDLVFGTCKYPLKYGFGLKVGSGEVVPEIKYFPKRNGETDQRSLKAEYEGITRNVLKRAVDLGLPSIQLDTEQTFIITKNPKLGGEITNLQKSIMEEYVNEYGLSCALRVTVADIRELGGEMRGGGEIGLMLDSFDQAAGNGADVLSIESIGGKEVFNYSVIRQDIEGALFSVGVLGSLDMEFLWRAIVQIAGRYGIVAGGDTDCAHGNTAMILADGFTGKMISHTFAATVRAMGAARSLVAYEQGATGPGKDCGYENVIIKAITGLPMSMEGKSSASAHSSLVGNVAAAACDLWSNEQVENVMLYGGWAPQVFTEILGYDTALMNAAIKANFQMQLRDLFVKAGPFDPQVLVLSPEGAWRIGDAIVKNSSDYYSRSREAALEALKVIEDGYEKSGRNLAPMEVRTLKKLGEMMNGAPNSYEVFVEKNLRIYKSRVENFSPSNYGL